MSLLLEDRQFSPKSPKMSKIAKQAHLGIFQKIKNRRKPKVHSLANEALCVSSEGSQWSTLHKSATLHSLFSQKKYFAVVHFLVVFSHLQNLFSILSF